MPRTVNQGFIDFHAKLTPSGAESQAASSHRASIEACLKNNFDTYRFFRTGSFGNGTSIAGYSDVDYFASIPSSKLRSTSDASLRMVRDALNLRFPNSGVHVSCPAVVVPFGTLARETTEIVPAAYYSKTGDDYHIYDIADCNGEWMKASPEAHNAYVRVTDINFSNKVKPLIRFMKAWKFYNNVPMSSFYIEMRVAKYANNETSIVYSYDVRNLFKLFYDNKLASLQDPVGISGYIHAASTQVKIDESYSKVDTAFARAEHALEEEKKGNINTAFYWWNLLFGNNFPSYYY